MAHVLGKKWRSDDIRLQENVDFSALLLSERTLHGLEKAGFKKPSPIQAKAIPMGRFGRDLLVQAKSGTGKTLVFVVIALEMLKRKLFRPQVLIIVPTREIAIQVCSVVKAVGSGFHKLTCNSFIGGLPLFEDQEKAVMTQIVVGTPGRLRQLIQLKALPTNSIRLLIFDEADELMQSTSFKDDLEDIFMSLPDEKQVIVTSATFSPKEKKMMLKYLGDPCLIRLNVKQLALLGMIHYAKVVEFCPMPVIMYKAKLTVLERTLKTIKFAQCLIFCNGIQRVEILYKDVKRFGFSVAYISSAKDQCDRLKAMERLKRFKCKVLVSSDLTSRGIDAENVDLVINFDLAYTSEVYVHRVGRAGRYGLVGVAISIVNDTELKYLQKIEKEGSFKAFRLPDPTPADLILNPPEGEFVIDEPASGNVDAGSEAEKSSKYNNALWNAFRDDECDLEEVSAESIQAKDVIEINVDEDDAYESELTAADDVEKEDPEKEIEGENIQVKELISKLENSGKKLITIDMLNNPKFQKQEFFCKTFKKFQESNDACSASQKNEKEDKEKSNQGNSLTDFVTEEIYAIHEKEDKGKSNEGKSLTDLISEEINMIHEKEDKEKSNEGKSLTDFVIGEINMVHEILAEDSEVENKEILPKMPTFESTPQPNDKIKKDTAKMTTDEAESKPVIQNKLSLLFQELSDESDSYNSETSEVAKETSSISSVSVSSSSNSESSSLSSNSEDESGSETEGSSESSSDYSESSSSTTSSENEEDESYHHNCSRTGRQNPSLVSGSVGGQVLNDRAYYDKYFEDCRRTSCGGRKKEIPTHNSYSSTVVGNPPYFDDNREISSCSRNAFQTRSRREQNVADHNDVQSSLPRKHSRCHRSRHSLRNINREGEDQSRKVCPTHQRSSRHRHHHTLNCFLPTGHRCHPNTPDYPCRHGALCEMWYKTFYNQWLHIQNVINN